MTTATFNVIGAMERRLHVCTRHDHRSRSIGNVGGLFACISALALTRKYFYFIFCGLSVSHSRTVFAMACDSVLCVRIVLVLVCFAFLHARQVADSMEFTIFLMCVYCGFTAHMPCHNATHWLLLPVCGTQNVNSIGHQERLRYDLRKTCWKPWCIRRVRHIYFQIKMFSLFSHLRFAVPIYLFFFVV